MNTETIAAVSTPKGTGGIGVIKISGEEAFHIAEKICKKYKNKSLTTIDNPVSRHMYFGAVMDPKADEMIDEVLFVFMKAPNTYTCEDVVEIHSHSGYGVLKEILDLVLKYGAVLARPGEFTKRAFLNGRIDLTRAEAVIDVINAKTSESRRLATNNLKGSVYKKISEIKNKLLRIYAGLEAWIDFPDDLEDDEIDIFLNEIDKDILPEFYKLVDLHKNERIIKQGFRVSLAGLPNVGKSLLMNRLLSAEKSIVTEYPGTTRDLIEDMMEVDGYPVILYDMAGIQETDDPVESIGIKKANEKLMESDFILFVLDASRPINNEEIDLFKRLRHKPILIICNKMDLILQDELNSCYEILLNKNNSAVELFKESPNVCISALEDINIHMIIENIEKYLNDNLNISEENPVIINMRQNNLIEKTIIALDSFLNGIKNGISIDACAMDIKEAINKLNEILGDQPDIDILDEIFNRFCIGK